MTYLGDALADVMRRYGPALRRLGHGPRSTEWPCAHAHTETDQRNGRRYCTVCWHWLEETPT